MQTNPNIGGIQVAKKIDTLVHLGAGRCSELDDYLALQPRHVLLVEADPQLAAALQKCTKGLPQVQVACSAMAGEGGTATFYRFNLPDVNSLHPPSGLLELFPGLKTVERLPVEAVSPIGLLEPLSLQMEQENRLVIDLPGEELPVLQALQRDDRLHLFSSIQLHCGREALYEGSEPASRVLHWLKEQGFDVMGENDSLDPDRPCWTLERNILQLRNRELSRQVQALQDQLEKQTAEHQQDITQLAQARDEQAKLAAERQSQIEQSNQAKAAAEKLAGERQGQIDESNQAKAEVVKLASERQTQIELLKKERDEQSKIAAERQQQITQLRQGRDEQAKLAGERQAQIEQLNQAKTAAEKLAAERQQQIVQLTQARDEQAKLAGERQAQIEQLNKANVEAEKLAGERQQHVAQLTQARDQQTKLAGERQSQIEQLTKVRDEQTKLATDHQAQIQQLTKKQADQKTLIEGQMSEIGKLRASLQEANNRCAQLEEQLPQMEMRQQLLNEELIKAEGQIDLIKDLLLRGPGL